MHGKLFEESLTTSPIFAIPSIDDSIKLSKKMAGLLDGLLKFVLVPKQIVFFQKYQILKEKKYIALIKL